MISLLYNNYVNYSSMDFPPANVEYVLMKAKALKKGDLISVALPNIGLVRATVKWQCAKNIAGEFQRPVDVRVCFRDETAA